jgi:hypothetical protein
VSGSSGRSFREAGAFLYRSVLDGMQIDRVAALFDRHGRPGKRLSAADLKPVVDLVLADGPIGRIASELIGSAAKPARGLLLDKSEAANWRLGWHQDRTIAVRERIEVAGFGPWSVKAGQPHVEPPHEVTAAMVTLRIHVDAVDEDNAPLEVVPGSHLLGRLTNDQVERVAAERAPLTCLAEAGDVWAYATAIVHASSEQRRPGRRRVLQLDYSTLGLPGGLEWMPLA